MLETLPSIHRSSKDFRLGLEPHVIDSVCYDIAEKVDLSRSYLHVMKQYGIVGGFR